MLKKNFQQKFTNKKIKKNCLLSKIEEFCEIAKKSRAAVISITESKLDKSVLDAAIYIEGYDLLRSDRDRHGGGVACYIKSYALILEQIFLQRLKTFSSISYCPIQNRS